MEMWSKQSFEALVLRNMPLTFNFKQIVDKTNDIFENPPSCDILQDVMFELLSAENPLIITKFDLELAPDYSITGSRAIIFKKT